MDKKGVIKRMLKNHRKRVGDVIEERDPGALVLPEDQLAKLRESRLYPLLQAPRESLGVGRQEGTRARAKRGHSNALFVVHLIVSMSVPNGSP